jgi:hypothetical protein
MTKFAFALLTCIWLAPMVILDFIGNSTATGFASDAYLAAFAIHGLLTLWAGIQLWGDAHPVAPGEHAHKAKVAIELPDIAAMEHIFCALLFVVALAGAWEHHSVNKESTGIVSMGALLWFFFDLVMAFVSGVQFWHLKGQATKIALHNAKVKLTTEERALHNAKVKLTTEERASKLA